MTRLQKKCLVVSVGFHSLLVATLLVTAAFRTEPTITQEQVLHFINLPLLDRRGVGGEPAAAPKPPRAVTQPSPAEASPARTTPLAPPTHPAATEAPKAASVATPKLAEAKIVSTRPNLAPPPRHHVDVNLTPAHPGKATTATKHSDTSAATQANSQEERRRTMQGIQSAFAELNSSVDGKESDAKVVPLPGVDGGEAFINYRTFIFNRYYQAWKTPDDTAHKVAKADVKIVVARNGDIISSEIVNKSGDASVDRSVERALESVKQLPPFPAAATDTERTFILRFDLEAKQSEG